METSNTSGTSNKIIIGIVVLIVAAVSYCNSEKLCSMFCKGSCAKDSTVVVAKDTVAIAVKDTAKTAAVDTTKK